MRAAALLACLIAACSTAPRRQPAAPVDAGVRAHALPATPAVLSAAAPAASPPPAAAPSALRVADASGFGTNLSVAGLGQLLATTAEGHAAIDLPNAARVRLEPNTRVVVLAFEPCAVLLVSGEVFVELLPQGNQPGRAELRVISALGTLVVSNTAELWLAQRSWPEPGSKRSLEAVSVQTQLTLLRGVAEFAQTDARGSVQTQPLVQGQVVSASKLDKPKATPIALDEARRASAEFMRQRRKPLRLTAASDQTDRALEASTAQQHIGEELMARLVAGVRAPDAGDVRAIQRELASHAQRKHALRQAVLLAAEHDLSAQLVVCAGAGPSGLECPSLERFLARFSGALAGTR